MGSAGRAKAVSYISVLVGFALIVYAGVEPHVATLRALLGAPGIALVILGLYDRRLWKIGPVGPPVLSGTWRGTIRSLWRDLDTGEAAGPIEVFMAIRQTASSITLTQLSKESRSQAIAASLKHNDDGQHDVAWAYRNEPLKEFAHRSPVHYGGGIISGISRRRPERLVGRYWTDRGTTGDLILCDRVDALADSYEEAMALFGRERSTGPVCDAPRLPAA